MAEEAIQSEQPEQPQLKENKTKKLMLYGGISLVQIIIAFVLVYFIIYPKYQQWAQGKESETKIEEKKERRPLGFLYTISSLTVNPKDTRGNRFAIFEIVLEMEDEEGKMLISQYEPVVVDKILGYLRTKTVEELSFQHLTSDIKVDLMRIVNDILIDNKVKNIYFTRFVLE